MADGGDLASFARRAAERWPTRTIEVLDETTSTNDVAKTRARAGAGPGLVVVADRQSAGRGRAGRSWHSPAGLGLYLSAVIAAPAVPTRTPLAAAVATTAALEDLVPGIGIKWPNDVLVGDGRKLGGILCEGLGPVLVVGIGVDVGHDHFPPELAAHAVSLRMLGVAADRATVALALVEALDAWLPRAETDWPAVRAAYLERCVTIGQPVRRADVQGIASGIDDDGALIVRGDDGRPQRVVTGDVEL